MKLFNILFTLFGVVTVIFFLFQILPGDPARMMMDQNEDVEQLEIIKKKYGFDEPILKQYLYCFQSQHDPKSVVDAYYCICS